MQTEEYLDPNYAANPNNRCYFCKSELHNRLHEILQQEDWGIVCDGANASDLGDDRPGMMAARERGVRSPLLEAGINKAEVRDIARHLGLPVWDKPAMACLSSRVPHGTPIDPQLLRQIEAAEDVLVSLGLRQFRVRHHDEIARLELPPDDLSNSSRPLRTDRRRHQGRRLSVRHPRPGRIPQRRPQRCRQRQRRSFTHIRR